MELIKAWCDGGCRGNQNENNIGAWAIYLEYWEDDNLICNIGDTNGERNTTNNIQELKGAINVLKAIKDKDIKVEIYLDSAYVLNGITSWINEWKKNGWKNSKKQDVANKELWIILDNEKNKFKDIVFIKVKGHSTDVGNNKVDKLLNEWMDDNQQFDDIYAIENKKYELYHGDCLEVVNKLIEQKVTVDAIITDPPYNISRENNFKTMGRAGIDFGEWDKDFDLTSWIDVYAQLLKKGGNIVIFNSWKNMSYIVESLEKNGFEVKDLIRWKKTNPMPRNRDRRFITDYEVAVWAVKNGGKWTFNRISETYERPEIICGITSKKEKLNGGHPTQKPIEVMEWLIERLTNENDIVLDCFMGSGSTGIGCMNLNRRFIGIELDEDYFNMAKERIENNLK